MAAGMATIVNCSGGEQIAVEAEVAVKEIVDCSVAAEIVDCSVVAQIVDCSVAANKVFAAAAPDTEFALQTKKYLLP